MGRAWQIFGESLIRLRFGAHAQNDVRVSGTSPAVAGKLIYELGLAAENITIVPKILHHDIHADDFGPEAAPDTMWMLGDVSIRMTLIHYDDGVLNLGLANSMGGMNMNYLGETLAMPPAGTLLGGGRPLYTSGCYYMGLNILPGTGRLQQPWNFPAAYLAMPPMELPLGTSPSNVRLTWRALPYVSSLARSGEFVRSNRAVLWDRITDTGTGDGQPVVYP